MPVVDTEALIEDRVAMLRAYHQSCGVERAEIDVSGGIDSAVLATLLARALGPNKVTAVFTSIHSSDSARQRAGAVCEAAGLALIVDDLSAEFDRRIDHMINALTAAGYARAEIEERIKSDATVLGSIRSCLRAPMGRGFNRLCGGGIRHGTGNECEDRFLRFYQKGGDGEVDTNPIAMLSKGEVYQLARALGVPQVVLKARPSPDLWGDGEQHNDEDELASWSGGVDWTYSRVDPNSGAYTRVGSIERVSRYLDLIDDTLFDDARPIEVFVEPRALQQAAGLNAFKGLQVGQIEKLLRSAKKLERQTRHKANPNIPALGDRAGMLAAGILSNELPQIG